MSNLIVEYRPSSGHILQVRHGDLTAEEVGAIVNAANGGLAHGGGVAGAIVRRGGYSIQEESDRWVHLHGPVLTGQVAVTAAGHLPCHWVIHAVGPVWQGGDAHEDDLLRQAVQNSLQAAEELEVESIALPAISSGIFGFPKERCAGIMVTAAIEFCQANPHSRLRQVRFTNIDLSTVAIFEREIRGYLL